MAQFFIRERWVKGGVLPKPTLADVPDHQIEEIDHIIDRACLLFGLKARWQLEDALNVKRKTERYYDKRYLTGLVASKLLAMIDKRIGQLVGVREELQRASSKALKHKLKKAMEKTRGTNGDS